MSNPREKHEKIESMLLSPYATKSADTKGRSFPEEKCDIRTDFQRDRDRIIHSKAFRRLKHKTQVFISPEGDHYRTRLTHTLEAAQIARTIARALDLNEDLTEAIALGHDLGHTPFGHGGEYTLNKLCPMGFEHCAQSLRVVEKIEKDGEGLNLTWEVRDGILNHRTAGTPATTEGCVLKLSDKIAYINHDIDDALRANVLNETEIPSEVVLVIGGSSSQRINNIIKDVISSSAGQDRISMSALMEKNFKILREFMFEKVYLSERALKERDKVFYIISGMYGYFLKNPDEMPSEFLKLLDKGEAKEIVVCDYIAGMTDHFATQRYKELFIPNPWDVF